VGGDIVNQAVATDSASKSNVREEESASSETNSAVKLNRLSGDATMRKPAGCIHFDPLNGHFTLGTFKDLEEEKISPVDL
jgi:hypothetical protein